MGKIDCVLMMTGGGRREGRRGKEEGGREGEREREEREEIKRTLVVLVCAGVCELTVCWCSR